MAGSAILAIAVSSEASASAVKIAATAQRLSSGGKPSMGVGDGLGAKSADILSGSPRRGGRALGWRVLRTRRRPQALSCMMRMRGEPPKSWRLQGYALGLNPRLA